MSGPLPGGGFRKRTGEDTLLRTNQGPLFARALGSPAERVHSLEGEVVRITYESHESGFRVVRVVVDGSAAPEVWVGVFPPIQPGSRVRATGRYVRDPKHGEQFKVESALPIAPSTLHGLEKYIGSGMIHGIGPVYAKRIVETFGDATLDVLDRHPERLSEVLGLGGRRAQDIARAWASQRALSAIMIFLQSHGVSPSLAVRIHKRFGANAIDVVSRSPYRLALDVWGVGFRTADRIARSIGIGADSPERAQAGVLQTLHDWVAKGHVFASTEELVLQASQMLECDEVLVREALEALVRSEHVIREDSGEGPLVFPLELHRFETRAAKRLASLIAAPFEGQALLAKEVPEAIRQYEKRSGVSLAPAQREAIEAASRSKVIVITGGPGVGKTTIVRALLSLFDRCRVPFRLAAPTGRAAKRLSETTGKDASTLHRLLEFDPKKRQFLRNKDTQIDTRAVVVDESSMLDLELADALLQAIPEGARLVLVGDVDQLPSVGPGAVLRDIIGSAVVPTIRLTQIFRQAENSLIVENAHRIHRGEMPEGARDAQGEFFVVERTDAESARDAVIQVVTERIPKRFGLDAKRDIQVLTPMHRGEVGAIALNERLQEALNPSGPQVARGARILRLFDKVMQLRNDYEREVYNGDIGFVSRVEPEERRVIVTFDDREVVYEEGDLDELTLAYATTIHKSQGSEYPAVVIPVLTQHFVMLSRNLIYTAVTRGKRLVVLVADPRAVSLALAELRKEERRTLLEERLRRALAAP